MKRNLQILDLDEHLRPKFETIHEKSLRVCEEVGAVLDLATSDTTMYLYAPNLEAAQKVADVYGTLAVFEREGKEQDPNLQWFCIECDAAFYEREKNKVELKENK